MDRILLSQARAARAVAYAERMFRLKESLNDVHRGAWVPDASALVRRMNQIVGAIGEQAVAQYFNLELDYQLEYRAYRPDFVVQGVRFDVKSTHLSKGRLIVPWANTVSADIYVLVRKVTPDAVEQEVEIAGWIFVSDAKAKHRVRDFFGEKRCFTEEHELQPMHTLFEVAA